MDTDRTIIAPVSVTWYLVGSKGNRIAIEKETIAGREVGCDLLLEEGRCSRKHAKLAPADNGLAIEDLGSSNGTFINDERITQGVARKGDTVKFDTAAFTVDVMGLPDVSPSAATVRAAPAPTPAAPAPSPVAAASSAREMPAPTPAAVPAPASPKTEKPAEASEPPKGGAWWAPKEEGPEGTMLMSSAAGLQVAPVEGTMVMSALGAAEPLLVGLTGTIKGRSFALNGDRWKIGRDSSECDVYLDDNGVSAFHAQIINEGSTWKLVNLMSSNGSFVNGQRVQTAYLNSGDRLRFGASELVFNLGGMPLTAGGGSAPSVTVAASGSTGLPGWVWGALGFVLILGVGAFFLL